MSRNRGSIFVAAVAFLAIAAAVGVAGARGRVRTKDDTAFARATGGVGLSSSASVSWSFFDLDPRLASACENEIWPIPGLACPNPGHGARAADYPPRDHWLVEVKPVVSR